MTAPAPDPGALLDRLEEVWKAATQGPWAAEEANDGDLCVTAGSALGLPLSFRSTDRIYRVDVGEWSGETEDEGEQRRADAALIVAAVNALGTLTTIARAALAVQDALHQWGDDLSDIQVRELRRALDKACGVL